MSEIKRYYIKGYLTALYDYAVNKDGNKFVGCGIYSLWEAAYRFLTQRQGLSESEALAILEEEGYRKPQQM